MNKKGFVLMETIIVIVVISVALLTIFSSYNKILTKVKSENKYDTSEYIYTTNYIKKYLQTNGCSGFTPQPITGSITDLYKSNNCYINTQLPKNIENTEPIYGIEKIYILTQLEEFGGNEYKLDAYMIDYIRKLDVKNNDKLIIVEYKKAAMDPNYTQKKDSDGNLLFETYIASLEW